MLSSGKILSRTPALPPHCQSPLNTSRVPDSELSLYWSLQDSLGPGISHSAVFSTREHEQGTQSPLWTTDLDHKEETVLGNCGVLGHVTQDRQYFIRMSTREFRECAKLFSVTAVKGGAYLEGMDPEP